QHVLRSEWTKLSSANWAVLIALPVVFSALSGWIGHTSSAPAPGESLPDRAAIPANH
ncbi:MAG: type transport system permease protein, partial [Micromonosporaceae bacterium]|nr:type transport system permease protein [Micromonosporaceae bacterium]